MVISLTFPSTRGQNYGVQITNQVLLLPKFLFDLSLKIQLLVFAYFRAQVLIIDAVKRATLSRLLLENIISTAPGEKLDEKLAALVIPVDYHDRLWLHHSDHHTVHSLLFSATA